MAVSPCRPFDGFRTATESLPGSLLRRASYMDPWHNVIKKGKYPPGTGVTQSVLTIQNSEPMLAQEPWADITLSGQQITLNANADSSICDPNYIDTYLGYDETTYGPRELKLRGPVICEDALTFHHNVNQFLGAYETELVKRSQRSWSLELENQYLRFARKYVDGNLFNGDGAPSTGINNLIGTLPTSELTQDMLDAGAAELISGDATKPDSDGFVSLSEEGPLFTLLIGVEMSARIAKNSPERRIDQRYAMPSELMKRVGATRVLGNWRHWVVTHPPRFNVVNGKLVRVPPKIRGDATHGFKAIDNPAYKNAEYEAAEAIMPSVYEAEIVVPYTGQTWVKFNPKNYNGEWSFVAGAYRLGIDCQDPEDKIGRHFATYKYAPKPMFPEHGLVFIYRRCPQDLEKSTCAS